MSETANVEVHIILKELSAEELIIFNIVVLLAALSRVMAIISHSSPKSLRTALKLQASSIPQWLVLSGANASVIL